MASGDTTLHFSRTIPAPRQLVWQAFSQLDYLQKWWGPKGCRISDATLDFQPGGAFFFCMEMPSGHKMWAKFVYRDITAPERIAYVSSFADDAGNITRAPFSVHWPLYVLNVITLQANAPDQTQLILSSTPLEASAEEVSAFVAHFSSMNQGFGTTFDTLVDYLNASRKG